MGGCGHRPEPRAGGTLWPALPLYLISFDVSNRQLPRGLVDTFSELLLLSVYPPASIPGGPGRDALQWSLCLGQLLAQPLQDTWPECSEDPALLSLPRSLPHQRQDLQGPGDPGTDSALARLPVMADGRFVEIFC